MKVRYVEPGRWRARQAALATGKFQPALGEIPLARYFRRWDFRNLKGEGYIRKKKRLENRPYFRAVYDDAEVIRQVQAFNKDWQLKYTINYHSGDAGGFSELIFEGDGSSLFICRLLQSCKGRLEGCHYQRRG